MRFKPRKPETHLSMKTIHTLAQRLPDIPRWVEVRALLRWGRCEIFGLEESPAFAFAIRDPATGLVGVVGAPSVDAIREAAARASSREPVIAAPEQEAHVSRALPEWRHTRAVLHTLPDFSRLPAPPPKTVRFLEPGEIRQPSIPETLARELEIGAEHSPIVATFVDGQPVSFAYAGSITESLFDVAIDTLPEHRRRGYAALCVSRLIRHLHERGKQPVWGATTENTASANLARKLGFVPTDELALWERY